MKIKQIISVLLALCILSSATAFAAVGGQDDPLISKSYVDGSYSSGLLSSLLTNLNESMTVLRYKLSKLSTLTAAKPFGITARTGDSITAESGGSFTVLSGELSLESCVGTLLDVTTGASVSSGRSLSAGHRYVCAESSRAVMRASSSASLGALGSVSKTAAVQISFSDVPYGQWYYADVYYAVDKGLINGKTATTYEPDGNLSYAEAIKLAACMHQLYGTGSISLINSPEGKWYDSYVGYALENGIISSAYPNYDAKISRSEFVAIFYSSLPASHYTARNSVKDGAIPDVSVSSAHAKEIYAFYRAGILIGSDGAGTFYPDSSIKRSEVAAVITRMYEESARKSITL